MSDQLAMEAKVDPNLTPIPIYKTAPWQHQTRGFWFAFHKLHMGEPQPRGGALLAMDMGTGKTKVVIDLINNSSVRTVLVTCPLSVVATWPEEFATHCSRPYRITPLPKGPVKKRTEIAEATWKRPAFENCVDVYVINHESVWREPFRSFVLKRQWDLLVVDECHRAKSPGGKFSRFLSTASGRFHCRLGLTGTPMPRDVLDIYAQGRFIDARYFGTSFTMHCNRFGVFKEIRTGRKDHRGNPVLARKLVGVRNEGDLKARLDQMSFRVLADDVLDLPPYVVVRRTCELDAAERRAYNDLKNKLITEIDGGYITAANALVKALRLQQIVQGSVRDDMGDVRNVGRSKQDLLRDVLEDLDKDEPVVVVCLFHSDLDRVADVAADLGRGCLELSGRMNQLEEFKKGGGPIIAVQIQSGGVGVDLSRAAYTVYFAPTYNMGAYEQSLRRTRRPSKHEHGTFFYYHLVAENTIDTAVYQALRDKKKITDAVLAGIRGI